MMELRLAAPEQVAAAYERDMRPAFPPAELKPLENILSMMEDGCYRPWCLFDGEEIAGECFLWLGRPGWALLDYLCVASDRRNGGLGARMLRELRRAELETVVLVESEEPEDAPDPERFADRRVRHGGLRRSLQDAVPLGPSGGGRGSPAGESVYLSKPLSTGEIRALYPYPPGPNVAPLPPGSVERGLTFS